MRTNSPGTWQTRRRPGSSPFPRPLPGNQPDNWTSACSGRHGESAARDSTRSIPGSFAILPGRMSSTATSVPSSQVASRPRTVGPPAAKYSLASWEAEGGTSPLTSGQIGGFTLTCTSANTAGRSAGTQAGIGLDVIKRRRRHRPVLTEPGHREGALRGVRRQAHAAQRRKRSDRGSPRRADSRADRPTLR